MEPEWQRQMAQDPWVRATRDFEPRAKQMLGLSPHSAPEDLLYAFEQQQRIAVEADQRLEAAQFTTTSEDRLISVTMTGKAQVRSLVIDEEAYLRYRPDELGPAVLDTLNDAMAHCGTLVRESLAGVFGPDDTVLDEMMQSWPAKRVDEGGDRPLADWT